MVQHVKVRIRMSLATASDRIDTVSVRLTDINGTRGGVDKRCRVVILLRHLQAIVVDAVHPDLYVAADDAIGRAKQSVWRHIKRRRTLRREYANRQPGPVPA
jgi:hypothetical protein